MAKRLSGGTTEMPAEKTGSAISSSSALSRMHPSVTTPPSFE